MCVCTKYKSDLSVTSSAANQGYYELEAEQQQPQQPRLNWDLLDIYMYLSVHLKTMV